MSSNKNKQFFAVAASYSVQFLKFELQFFFIKDKITGRIDKVRRIFEKIAKKLKFKSQYQKNIIYKFFR